MNQEVVFAGCAAHSMAGRSDKTKKWDGVEEKNVLTFSRIMPGVNIAKVVAGNAACHFFLIGADGQAFGFGRNEDGQLGFGDEINRYKPTPVKLPENASPIIGGSCGGSTSFLFGAEGDLYSCGTNNCGQLGVGKVTAEPIRVFSRISLDGKCICVAAGKDFAVCCTSSGDTFSWGSPENGQLGNGTEGKSLEKAGKYTYAYRSSPGKVEGLSKFDPACGIVQVACGSNHTLAMDAEGRLYTWGFGGYGRLGLGDAKDKFSPEAIPAFCNVPPPPNPNIPAFAQRIVPKLRARKISCGQTCCYAILGEPFFSLYFWGVTKRSGEATLRPTVVEELQSLKMKDVATGFSSTIVAMEDHTIVTWGPSPTYGELGYGEGVSKSSTKAKEVDSLRGIKTNADCIAAGYAASFVLVDINDEESKKVLEECPILEQEEIPALAAAAAAPAAGKKREAAPKADAKKAKKKA